MELANAFVPVQDGRIYIEKINGPFLQELKGTPAEYKAGLESRDLERLARDARERDLCKIHRVRRRAVRLIQPSAPSGPTSFNGGVSGGTAAHRLG